MLILAFDCSTGPTSVALTTDNAVLAHLTDEEPRGQAERLLPLIDHAVSMAGVAWTAIDRIAVTLGPGSFTGVRIGLAAAKGLALALDRPICGFSTLEVMAAAVTGGGPLVVAVDARRGEIYGQCFIASGDPAGPPEASAPADFAARLEDGYWHGHRHWRLIGSGAPLIMAAAQDSSSFDMIAETRPDAVHLARLAAMAPVASAATLEPLYLRAPDAIPQNAP